MCDYVRVSEQDHTLGGDSPRAVEVDVTPLTLVVLTTSVDGVDWPAAERVVLRPPTP